MKVFVYAISKNEEIFAKRWYESMKEADDIFVLDTGSKDKTVDILKKLGVNVKQAIIEPWRFDTARNMSLEMVPYEECICVCTDLDEVFEIGWRKKLESIIKDCDRVKYNYIWSFDKYGNPEVNFYQEKIHKRKGYKWVNPVHEVLKCELEKEKIITTDEITLKHYPDDKKSRSSYLPLLELAVKEEPDNDRNMHYLGREYMYYHKYQECIDTLIKHLNLKNATWKDERCASMRFIARSYRELKRYEEAKMWYNKAIDEAPYLRDPYVELAILYYILEDWEKVIYYSNKALEIKDKQKTYINEQFSWDNTIYDLLSLAYYHTNNKEKAIENINIALSYDPNNQRLLNNKIIYEEMKS